MVVALAAASTFLPLPACAYSTSRLVDEPGVRTVAVQQFDNQTYYRDLEMRLTKAVAEEVRARTPWTLDAPSRADVVLTGTIRTAQERVLVEEDYDAKLKRFRMTVESRLVERSTGRVLRTWTSVSRESFAPERYGESLEGSTTDTVVRSLAQEVVQGLERPIGDPGAAPPPFKSRKLIYREN